MNQRSRWLGVLTGVITTEGLMSGFSVVASAASSPPTKFLPTAVGELDCNGQSLIHKTVKTSLACSDVRGIAGVSNAHMYDSHFYDNGVYIGHDEPDLTFLSSRPGSGNSVSWTETLPRDPTAKPTVATAGSDVAHWFELSVAPWFSMDLCNGNSYPLLPCVPNSDANAPACPNAFGCSPNVYPGGGSAFMEMQFYPPGDAPFVDSVSCDNAHWCASLHINDLECTLNFVVCNNNCVEPTNFAFIQTNGVPTGPPSPQLANNSSFTPNAQTFLMNPGDKLKIHIFDAPAPGGGKALVTSIVDFTTGQSGFMQASAANGFASTSIADCSGTPFNYEPEYNTAKAGNIAPWTALQTNISTQFEIGHFEACTSVTKPIGNGAGGATDPIYSQCNGPYEATTDSGSAETSDAACWKNGSTHGALNSDPNLVAGCLDNIFQNGDLDFDGSPYWPEWPTGANPTATFPGSFVQSMPTSNGQGYARMMFQTDLALSESTCKGSTGCTVPPVGPGNFYPYWSVSKAGGSCSILFGNVSAGVNTFGGTAQYGTNRFPTLGYPEFESAPISVSSVC